MSGAYAKEDFKRECVPVRKLCGRCPAVNRMLVQKGRNIRTILTSFLFLVLSSSFRSSGASRIVRALKEDATASAPTGFHVFSPASIRCSSDLSLFSPALLKKHKLAFANSSALPHTAWNKNQEDESDPYGYPEWKLEYPHPSRKE